MDTKYQELLQNVVPILLGIVVIVARKGLAGRVVKGARIVKTRVDNQIVILYAVGVGMLLIASGLYGLIKMM